MTSTPFPSIPATRYAESDGVSIAYQVLGDEPIDVVMVPGFGSHLERAWELPRLAHFYHRLSSFSRLILLDKRGTGLSDRVSPEALPGIEQRKDDLKAMMDAEIRFDRAYREIDPARKGLPMYRGSRYAWKMAKAVSVRLDDDALRALRRLEATGLSRSEAIRKSVIEAASRLQNMRALASEVAALEADDEDRLETLAVADLMESLRAPG